ncbi:protein-disulfide reductase DsbD [Marinimicrobium sp. ABcell2]|uniref:protein-disulfide reductase DsbD family protein n=1 Tax=Marinimicrobium sp. ABcell2 TaxID=3069751 RepID=UPI0027B51B1B|nr:protein-disulfide reductase DsbD [Marinimicrobium sp. ABcell2]MDQ2078231.1 protein-disulfide reductase DsbD [Marinimicrobium sp. ABcell2]
MRIHFFLSHLRQRLSLLLIALFLAPSAMALGGAQQSSGTSLLGGTGEFLPVTEAFQLDARIYEGQLILHWDIAPEYYLYKERFKLAAQDREAAIEVRFSDGHIERYDEFFDRDMDVYYQGATLTLPVDGEPFTLRVESQGCADAGLCYPPHADYLYIEPELNSVSMINPEEAQVAAVPPSSGRGPDATSPPWLPHVLILALLGGIILNLMPCVFPVLSIKVMSLAKADRERLPLHGWAYTAGIVLCFLIFAGVLLLARAGGQAIGWGFQLQSPLLIAALAYLFFVLGLSLSGTLQIGTRWMGAGQNLTQKSGLSGSFFTGVLAAVVASPCTAPFMGAALGFALTQPTVVSLSVFAALGLGMALPLLLLCYSPALVRYLPQPGPWMDTLKQFLAFPLYLTAIWLLWVLGRQAGTDAIIAVVTGALAIIFATWLLNRPPAGRLRKGVRHSLALAALAGAVIVPWQLINQEPEAVRWQAYSPERLAQLRAEGRPVFINLTADWCLTCLANERMTLNTRAVEEAFDEHQVATLKGDWTNQDPQISALLDEYGRSGVPLYLWFPAGEPGPGQVLPQILRRETLLNVIKSENTDKNRSI